MKHDIRPVLEIARDWLDQDRQVAVATVIETWGSAPQPVSSKLIVDGDGNFEGSVTGGCVEGAVVTEAREVIRSKKIKVLEFGVSNESAWNSGLACGGTIRVLVEPVEDIGDEATG